MAILCSKKEIKKNIYFAMERRTFQELGISAALATLLDQKEKLQREIFGIHQVRQNLFLNIQQMQMDMQRMGIMPLKYESLIVSR